uniref:Uncharacterized protein n=1 Tax=Meloidogyne enterolobii TaxID=390850 RepID=A0A6V7V866_MELEN|nr:unnamed protein product [Meloidogyne enterolobii]
MERKRQSFFKSEDDLGEEDLPHYSHSTDPTTTSLDDYYGENMHAEETPDENDNKNMTSNSDGENKINKTVDFDGENCVLAEGKGLAFKIKNGGLEYATNGSIKVRETKDEGIINTSMKNIENLSTKTCSIGNYEQFSYCARLKFFGSKGIDIVKNGTLFERNNPKTISEYKKNYMQDMVLVMIEGCVICRNASNQTITLKFIQSHPKGPIENACPEINENISTLDLDLTKYNNGFIVGGIVSDRLCPSRKSFDDEIEIAPLTYKHKLKIEIEHSCEGEKTKHVINFASEIDIKNLTDNVFEMRGLSINLTGNSTEETYDWEKADEYFSPKKAAELKTTTELVPKIEAINNTTEASNTTTIGKIVLPKNGRIYDEEKEGEKVEEDNEEDKEDEIKQGEENVVEMIYLEETTHSNDEGKENEVNKNEEITTSKPEEVSTKIGESNEEKENEKINEKLEEKHNDEKEEGDNEIKEEEGKDDNKSKDEAINKGNEEENDDGEKKNLKENEGEN